VIAVQFQTFCPRQQEVSRKSPPLGKMLSLTLAAVCFLLGGAHFVRAGFVPPAELCLPDSGLKELSGCIAMDSRIDSCKAKPNREEALDCYCVQEMLDSYYACKEDVYKCVRSHVLDPQFDDNIRGWHQACDGRLATKTTTITTPPEPTLTSTYDLGACNRLATSCFSGDYETNLCSRSWLPTSSLSFISCTCRPPVYSLMSECFYNGNISCKLEPGYKTNIPGYSQCPYFWSGSVSSTAQHDGTLPIHEPHWT